MKKATVLHSPAWMTPRLWVAAVLWTGVVAILALITVPAGGNRRTPKPPPTEFAGLSALWLLGLGGIMTAGRFGRRQDDRRRRPPDLFGNSRETLQMVLDTIPSRVFWKDRNSVLVGCNRRFAQDAGCDSPAQVVGKTDFDFAWREHAETYVRDDRRVIESGQPKLNYLEPQTTADGRQVWLRTSKIPWRGADGAIIGVLGVYEDVTERRRAEQRLREQADLIDIAHDAIAVLDLEDRILYWNDAAEKLYGWPVEEALGCNANRLFFGEAAAPPEFLQARDHALKHGEWSGELRQTHRDGKPVIVQSRATLVRDASGKAKSLLFVSTDMTEQRALEAKFLRVQRLETIGALASGVAHDLNNVLAPISMAVDILRQDMRTDKEQSLLQILANSVQRGSGLVRQLLTFGRGVEASRMSLRPNLLIKEICRIIQETFPKSIRLQIESGDDDWEIMGDPTQIHQVLLNLCVNARDAMPDGGVLTLAVRNVWLGERAASAKPDSRSGPHVALEVADTGTGMTSEVLGKIFSPFFTTKPLDKGTGLGLSTVRDITRSHGGFVEVWSQVGKGTRFTVYFPAAHTPAVAVKDAEMASAPLGNGELVLVADDEQSILKLAKNTLETHGYRVLAAGDGREALTLFARHVASVRAVVIDLMMPHLDGAAAIQALRAQNPRLPIVAISGAAPDPNQPNSRDGIAFLPKPFTVQSLLSALESALSGPRSGPNESTGV